MAALLRSFLCVLLLASPLAAETFTSDVIVYGATPGGVCAAIGAARAGAKVILVEPSKLIGGVNTGGLAFSDSNQMVRAALGGLFAEFHERIEADYTARGVTLPYRVFEKDHRPWTYEPHVAARVTDAMLAEAGVVIRKEELLQRVEKAGARLSHFTTAAGHEYRAPIFIDATYEGDLLAAAGVSFHLGREGRAEFGESLAGRQYPKAPMPISGRDATGKLLPLLTGDDAGPETEGDDRVMVYSFRLCLTKDPANRVPFPAPAKYDPARFEAIRRYYAADPKAPLLWDLYPLPGNKVDANNGIAKQFSMGLMGAQHGWCAADVAGRARLWEEHRQYTLEMYHFLTTDAAVPTPLREQLAAFGLCRDEFPEYGHWSPQLYVREGRKMRGAYVMAQKDILTDGAKADSIAVASFPIDSHDCQRVARGDGEVINEGTIFPVQVPGTRHGAVYQVPYRSITPVAAECENLLVPVALSSTHVAYSSIRVEPAWMTIGHSAGVAAALCAKAGLAVQALPYEQLRPALVKQKQVLDLPATLTLWDGKKRFPSLAEIKPAPGIEYSLVERLSPEWQFLHEPRLGFHEDTLFVNFSHAPKLESEPAQEIHGRRSTDGGRTWSEREVVAPTQLGQWRTETATLLSHGGQLHAFVGRYADGSKSSLGMDLHALHAGRFVQTQPELILPSFVPFALPQRLANGSWIMSGHTDKVAHSAVAISEGDNLQKWRTVRIETPQPAEYPETSLLVKDAHVVALIRRSVQPDLQQGRLCALVAESHDSGATFTPARVSNLPMQNSKPFSGTLSDGRSYAIFNAAEGPRRNTLLLALSAPGEFLPFRKVYKLIEGTPAALRAQMAELNETTPVHEWAYPEAVEKDGTLYIVISQNKRHCWLLRVPVAQLK